MNARPSAHRSVSPGAAPNGWRRGPLHKTGLEFIDEIDRAGGRFGRGICRVGNMPIDEVPGIIGKDLVGFH
jgi:hypothetical protein